MKANAAAKKAEEISFPYLYQKGSVRLRIYKGKSHGSDCFTLSYWQDRVRKRPAFTTFEKALAEAKIVADRLGSSDSDVLKLSSADRASYLRATELLAGTGISLEVAVAQYVDAIKRLGNASLAHAVVFYLRRHPADFKLHLIKNVADEMIASKKSDGLSKMYLRRLRYDMDKFIERFSTNISMVTGAEIDAWLRGMDVAGRTRNNLRTSIQTLFSYAKSRRYLAKDHDEMDSVPLAKVRGGDIEVFTPAELAEAFNCAEPQMIPFLALGAFAGIRHAEIQRLEWKDILIEESIIEIRASKAKTASRRTIPITENLKRWLLPYRQPSGLVCTYQNMAAEICRLVNAINEAREKAKGAALTDDEKFKWKHNALRHSFISYRIADIQNVAQVSLEAGNSPQMIFKHYRELVRAAEAKKWFSIAPAKAENVLEITQEKNVAA